MRAGIVPPSQTCRPYGAQNWFWGWIINLESIDNHSLQEDL
jgi:hypothetical protein